MSHLAHREVNELHTECGQTLAGALLQQGLVDEMVIYMAPKILGNQARGCFELGEITQMSHILDCSFEAIRRIGDDMRLTLLLNSRDR